MIFNFLKYIQPIWYFNLKPVKDYGYFPSIAQLSKNNVSIEIDKRYKDKISQERDVAWIAFQSGFINLEYKKDTNIWDDYELPIIDEYIFLRKNFHYAWVVYVLLIRIITFHNPFKELFCFFKTIGIKKEKYIENQFEYKKYDHFESELIKSNPFVTVIIPTLNRYSYLEDVLKDLELQDYKNFEVIVVDQSEPFKEDFYKDRNLNLRYWYQHDKALWKARNDAIKNAKGDLVLLYDDDSRVEENWISEHLKVLDFFKADISSGVSLSTIGAKIPKHYSYFRWSEQLDTGNVLLKKEIFDKIGYFDLKFEKQRMGDGEFGLRCYLNGYKNISNFKAKRIHLKVSEGGLRQMGSWDGWRPKKLFGPRPVPSVLYLTRKYFGNKLTILYILKTILPSLVPYKFKKYRFLKIVSFVLLPIFLPLVLFQIITSWKLASEKLIEN